MNYIYLLSTLLLAPALCNDDIDASEDSWSKLQISPKAITSMPYMNFRINIYGDSGKLQASQARPKYFYAPVSVLDPDSPVSRRNNVTNDFEMVFRVFLWSEQLETQIARYLTKVLRTDVDVGQVQVIPFDKVILASTVQNDNYRVSSDWIPYQFHQDLRFKIICYTEATCDSLAKQMHFNPEQFSHLKLQFSLDSQQSRRRETIIRVESIQSGSLFSELNQRFPKADEVLLTAADTKRLLSESATNVILETFSDEEVVAQQAQSPIYSLLEQLMIAGREAIKEDSSERWSSVFWDNDNYRPDKTTKTINEVYRNSVSEAQEKLKEVLSSGTKVGIERELSFEEFSIKAGLNVEHTKSNEKEKEKFLKTIQEAKYSVQWEGEKFVPKPMVLSRVNMAKIRNSQTLHDLKTQVTYTNALLSTAINTPSYISKAQLGGPLEALRYQLETEVLALKNHLGNLDVQVGTLNTKVGGVENQLGTLKTDVTPLVDKSRTPVYFSAYRKARYYDYMTILPYDGAWVNVGDALDIKTGIFTVPYKGLYYFSFDGHVKAGEKWMSLVLEINGKGHVGTGHHQNKNYASSSMSIVVELSRGDKVGVLFASGTLYDVTEHGTYYGPFHGTSFIGMLLEKYE